MPIFEYQCLKCGHKFEELVLVGKQPELECPSCSSGKVKKLLSAGSIRPRGIPKGAGGFKPPACARSGS